MEVDPVTIGGVTLDECLRGVVALALLYAALHGVQCAADAWARWRDRR